MTTLDRLGVAAAVLVTGMVLSACTSHPAAAPPSSGTGAVITTSTTSSTTTGTADAPTPGTAYGPSPSSLPYVHDGADGLTGAAVHARSLVYVPNQMAGTLQIIDPRTFRVIATHRVPASPEHVVPSWDLTRLWVNSDKGNALTPLDPRTGRVGRPLPVADPYNLYSTPDGRYALAMASRDRAINALDPRTMRRVRSLRVPMCAGVNHADFTADLSTFVASCEFNGRLLVVDAQATRVEKVIDLNAVKTPGATAVGPMGSMSGPRAGLARGASSMPQDVRLTPDGRWFMVADMLRNGVWFIDASTFRVDHFVWTGRGAHGIYPSRDAKRVFVSNRDAGTITVFDATTNRPIALWRLPRRATPDMGGVTADGSQLWLSGRYSSEVYVIDTRTGRLLHRIHTMSGPHGLLVWPQPGRFSLGHTGNMR